MKNASNLLVILVFCILGEGFVFCCILLCCCILSLLLMFCQWCCILSSLLYPVSGDDVLSVVLYLVIGVEVCWSCCIVLCVVVLCVLFLDYVFFISGFQFIAVYYMVLSVLQYYCYVLADYTIFSVPLLELCNDEQI